MISIRVRTEIDDAQSCILRLDSRWRHFLSIFGDVASTLGTIEATLKGLTLDIAVGTAHSLFSQIL